MAAKGYTIIKREGKNKTSYRVQVKIKNILTGEWQPFSESWKPPRDGMSEKQIDYELEEFAEEFLLRCKEQFIMETAIPKNVTVEELGKHFIKYLETADVSDNYRAIVKDGLVIVNSKLGKQKVKDITPYVVKAFVKYLDSRQKVTTRAIAKNLMGALEERMMGRKKLSIMSGVAMMTINVAKDGGNIMLDRAEAIAKVLGGQVEDFFDIHTKTEPYAAATKNKPYEILSALLSYAVQETVIRTNYATAQYVKGIPIPKKPKIRCMDVENGQEFVYRLLYEETDLRLKVIFLLFMLIHPRRGEVVGLEWTDFVTDAYGNYIAVDINRSHKQVQGKGVMTGELKTDESERRLYLPRSLSEILQEYKMWWDDDVEARGDRYNGVPSLFMQRDGRKIHPASTRYWMSKLVEKYGLQGSSIHGLRHTGITAKWYREDLIPHSITSEDAGHTTQTFTKRRYVEKIGIDPIKQQTAQKIDEVYGIQPKAPK